jgi:TonB family protein
MKTLTTTTAYGYQELRQVYQRNMMFAMLAAIIIQMMAVGGYHLSEWLKTKDDLRGSRDGTIIDFLPPPPLYPLNKRGIVPIIAANLAKGIPVPVPDAVVDTNMKFATQGDLSNEVSNAFNNLNERLGNGIIEIPPVKNDPTPVDIWRVEKLPVAVMTPKPEYPNLAIRTNMEGYVYVKVLLDIGGKVKKSELLKASDDIFAQAALDASQKWVFTPALMNGKPVQVWVSIPFKFRLSEN